MKKLALSAFALLCAAGTAQAAPIALPGDTPIYIQFNNIEQVNGANNLVVPGYAPAAAYGNGQQGNWGLFNISTMQLGGVPTPHVDISGGSPFFFDDDGFGDAFGMGQVTGIFYGIDFTSPTTANGGVIDLYWHDNGSDSIDANCLAGITCLPDAATVSRFTTGSGGILLARLNFNFGIQPGDESVFLKSDTDPTTLGGSGQADAFADVDTSVIAPWTQALNGNWFFVDGADAGGAIGNSPNEFRDLRFSTFFNATLPAAWNVGPTGTQGLRSNDPARVFTSPVPEPATLGLLGVGLLGLVARARRRKAA
jgi:hypothetical protein